MRGRAWVWRAVLAVGLALVANLVLALVAQTHDAVRVSLLVVCVVAVAGAVVDGMRAFEPVQWKLPKDLQSTPTPTEVTLASYQRLLDSNRSARQVDDRLQTRLLALAEDRLRQTRGLSLSSDSTEVRTLLGPDLLRLRAQTPRRLTDEEINRIIDRIEEM